MGTEQAFERAWREAMDRIVDRIANENELLAIAARGGPFWGATHAEAVAWLEQSLRADHDPGDEDPRAR